ncbi:GNAT family N-acetyltransferase [Shouchella hunanensis]|uniref:GNAT family protein n=1 Tax=Shouchella hunanensis TaxID=766894 RepID=A0ABY7WG34_9BACI|nr:GNAT family protein [Shouchella hunanensis]WDF05625.1 GNAT family protein [Shouchella hunanensis]
MNIVYREARKKDAKSMIDHVKFVFTENPTFYGTRADEFQMTIEQEEQWIEKHQKHGFLYLAEIDDVIAGMIHFLPSKSKRLSHQGMVGISIKEFYAGQGIGTELMTRLLRWAKAQANIEKVSLEVFSNNERGLSLYKKLGFQEEGRLKRNARLDDGTYVDDIRMAQFV